MLEAVEADNSKKVDPLFVALVGQMKRLKDHSDGVLQIDGHTPEDERNPEIVRIAYVMGLLRADKVPGPRVMVDDKKRIKSDPTDPAADRFVRAYYVALGEAEGPLDLAGLVLPLLLEEGNPDGRGGRPGEVRTAEFAEVMRCLAEKGVTSEKPQQLRRRINECLNTLQNVGKAPSVADMGIELPDLNIITAYQIQESNVEAMGPMICAAMFDELKVFDVVDTLVELWQNGIAADRPETPGRCSTSTGKTRQTGCPTESGATSTR